MYNPTPEVSVVAMLAQSSDCLLSSSSTPCKRGDHNGSVGHHLADFGKFDTPDPQEPSL